MLRRVVWQKFTDVSEVLTASIITNRPVQFDGSNIKLRLSALIFSFSFLIVQILRRDSHRLLRLGPHAPLGRALGKSYDKKESFCEELKCEKFDQFPTTGKFC
jgi:hypothetical protein